MTTYEVTSGRIVVTARSMVHDTRATWDRVTGRVAVDLAAPGAGATATLEVDMRAFDAGDRLKNWKLKSDLDPDRWPSATFRLTGLTVGTQAGERLDARAVGQLGWRGREVEVTATGAGTLAAARLEADARFDLDVRTLGVTPPKVLLIKVDPIVSVTVTLAGRPAA